MSDETKPRGMQFLFAAGGLHAVLYELKERLELDCITVSGQTLAARLAQPPAYVDRPVVRAVANHTSRTKIW